MANIKRILLKSTNGDGFSEIQLRLTILKKRFKFKSRVRIPDKRFKADGTLQIPVLDTPEKKMLLNAKATLEALERDLLSFCESYPEKEKITTQMLQAIVDGKSIEESPKQQEEESPQVIETENSFFDVFESYIHAHERDPEEERLTCGTLKTYNILKGIVRRFQAFERAKGNKEYIATLKSITTEKKADFMRFMADEREAYCKFPKIYNEAPSDNSYYKKFFKPEPRSLNYVSTLVKKINAIVSWSSRKGFVDCQVLKAPKEQYNKEPLYITKRERDAIAQYDFGSRLSMEIQRDIFIFQCYVGCRVSDLMRLTIQNVILEEGEETLSYVATKTIKDSRDVIKVPLHDVALRLLHKYDKWRKANGTNLLFPFRTAPKYNEAIKEIFTTCGINRLIVEFAPMEQKEVSVPLSEKASSHIARKTFSTLLGMAEVSESIIDCLTGHRESGGHKVLNKYYLAINHAMKRNAINKL